VTRGELVNAVKIQELSQSELAEAALVLGRGMRDNPLHVWAFGLDPLAREQALRRVFDAVLRQQMSTSVVLSARSAGALVGVCGMACPGTCQPTMTEKLRLVPLMLAGAGVGPTIRLAAWISRWARHDPKRPHWHLGPVGVERHLQGQGIGSELLREFCRRMDDEHATAYLETDKGENVTFYRRFGFRVTAEDEVVGVPNWFMTREPL